MNGMISTKDARSVALFLVLTLVTTALAASAMAPSVSSPDKVDFRYALPWWQTAICLPDDPDKTLVGKEGQLLFDYGGGGVRNFGLSLQPEMVGGTKWIRQQTVSARAPIVQTLKDADGVEVLEETFVVIPKAGPTNTPPRLTRTDGGRRLTGWAKPVRECAAPFTGVDVAYNGKPLEFRLAVPAGHKVMVVFGLCEGWYKEPGKRPLVLTVEGGEEKIVDPVKDFGANQPGLYTLAAQDTNRDGIITIRIGTPQGSEDRNAILNALWVFDGPLPTSESIITGDATASAFAFFSDPVLPERQAVVLVTVKNTTSAPVTCQPELRVQSVVPLNFQRSDGSVTAGDGTRISASERIELSAGAEGTNFSLRLPAMTLQPGIARQSAFTVDRHTRKPVAALSVDQARRLRDAARQWWEHAPLPWDTIQVPDAGIQGMLESCVRNIWQAREIKNGQPAFHVGPTVYRGLWVVDGAFLLESAALVGRAEEARAGIQYILGFQQPDGRIQVMEGGLYHKENGIVLWMCCRHAALTQDKVWLESVWPKLERIVGAIQRLRERSRAEPPDLDDGLMPTGFTDGGIGGNNPEYSNVYWNLAGLKAVCDAAQWLGKKDQAAQWRNEYDDFMATFRKAAERDMATDPFGNRYLPTVMGEAGKKHLPQRGQWAFLHAVYPGQIFAKDDPLVQGNLAMLRATKQQGLVFGTGWDDQGIWTYAASFYGHALLWQGCGQEASQVLYDYANHAAPLRVWREEQRPVGKGGHEVGDMPHNWASAEFIRLAVHLIELDRGDELHLLEGFPRAWAGPGMVTRFNGVPTPFGPLHLSLGVDDSGKTATLEFKALAQNCQAVVVHLPDGTTRRLAPNQAGRLTIPIGN
jgi:hypothetical protein